MTFGNCDPVRDALPDAVSGALPPAAARAVLEHAATCPHCAEELRLIEALRRSAVLPPAGLQERVLRATSTTRAFGSAPAHWARNALLAAVLGTALLGGAALLRRAGSPVRLPTRGGAPAASVQLDGRSLLQRLPGSEDGLDSAPVTLDDLSTEQLQTLLKEMQS